MWILESTGDFLQGKRIWLRPGKKYLFGRVKKEGVSHAIDHKTISRKHFVIEVAPVKPGHFTQLHTRSKVTISDEKSKGGTQLDGHQLRGGQIELHRSEHSLRPGTYPHELKIKWVPACFNFSLSTKERKTTDPLASKRERLEELDIKGSVDYVIDKTTHVIQAKRNTVAGLQALLNGKFIATDEFVDAVVYGATPGDLEEPENLCPLERDFDLAWPDPLKYTPPPGKEQMAHPAEAFNPNPERNVVFEGYIFVFGDPKQQDNLLPAITNGHGKALVCKMEHKKTKVEDIVKFMRNVATGKSFGESDSPSEKGGVILVRWITKPEMQEWANELAHEVALRIGQQAIDQREFLDAIVRNDARVLRRAPESADSQANDVRTLAAPSSKPISLHVNDEVRQSSPSKTPEEAQKVVSFGLRARDTSRIKAFDDDFDIDSITSVTAAGDDADDGDDGRSESVIGRVEENELSDHAENILHDPETTQGQRKRKRTSAGGDEEGMVDELLPAAAAMKKRRFEAGRLNGEKNLSHTQAKSPKKIKAEPRPEIDVREAAKKRREAEEEIAQQDKAAFSATIDDEELRRIRETLVEEMEIPVRIAYPPTAHEVDSRWDENWNGRKNFKGFRRKGDAQWRQNHTQKIMVPLVEAKEQSFGIGRQYWDDSDSENAKAKRKKKNSSQGQESTQTNIQTQTTTSEHISPTMNRLQQEAEDMVGEVDVEQPRVTRLADKTQQSQRIMNQAQGIKRPGPGLSSRTNKRQKTIRLRGSDDDDDEPKFEFGRRKRT